MVRIRWTERHTATVGVALLCGAVGVVAALESGAARLVCAVLAVVALVGGLAAGSFGSLVVGLVVAAVYVETKRRSGAWSSSEFGVAAAGTLSLFGLAWMSGVAAQLFSGAADGEPTQPLGAQGSMGLLDEETAMLRLDEEIARSARTGTELSLLVVRVLPMDDALEARTSRTAYRAVGRLVESTLGPADVAFADADGGYGAILPGVPLDEAFERVGTLAETARRITVSDRSAAQPGLLVDHVELAGTATALAGRAMSASDLLREALDRLSSQPLPGPAEGQWYDVGPVGEGGRQ